MITLLCTLIIGGHAIRSELPLYLAIFASDNHESQIEMRLSVLSAVNELLRSYPEDENLIILKSDLLQGNQVYRSPPNLHITTFYIGGKADAEDSEYFKNFKVDLHQNMKIHAIAILPKKVIACVMRREDYAVPIENKYPHMTTLLGAWTAVDSNVLMASLFDEGKPLASVYQSLFEESLKNQVWATRVNAKGETGLPAYLVKFAEKGSIRGITKYGYF